VKRAEATTDVSLSRRSKGSTEGKITNLNSRFFPCLPFPLHNTQDANINGLETKDGIFGFTPFAEVSSSREREEIFPSFCLFLFSLSKSSTQTHH